MADTNDCPCPESSPTPKQGDAGQNLPMGNAQTVQRIQLVGEQSKDPSGESVTKALKIGPRGGIVIEELPNGFNGSLVNDNATFTYSNGRLTRVVLSGSGDWSME